MSSFLSRLDGVLEARSPITLVINDEEGLSKIEPGADEVPLSLSLSPSLLSLVRDACPRNALA